MSRSEASQPATPRFCCLLYHGIEDQRRFGYLSAARFRGHVEILLREGFTIEGFDGVLGRLATGIWPNRYIVLTFDDGHRSSVEALEILAELGGSATLFVATRASRIDPRYLDAPALRRLADWTHLGSHSVTHRRLDQLSRLEVHAELADSKAWLEDVTGRAIDTFSAPSGAINTSVRDTALELGYRLLGNSVPWWNTPDKLATTRIVRRLAIDYAFSDARYGEVSRCDLAYFVPKRARALLLALPKRLLFAPAMAPVRKPLLSLWKRWR